MSSRDIIVEYLLLSYCLIKNYLSLLEEKDLLKYGRYSKNLTINNIHLIFLYNNSGDFIYINRYNINKYIIVNNIYINKYIIVDNI